MKQEKKKKIMTVVGIVILLLIVIGASYAYFIAQIGSGASTNVTIEADTVDSLQFTTSGELGIKLNQDNFASGGGNKKASTTARATLIAGTNRSPSYTYNVYLAIKENTFFHTTNDNKPELILRITNPSNEAITALEGLTYNSTLSGFDVTEIDGVITLASNYEITTTSTLRQNWKVEVEVINLDSDQSDNAGRKFDAELIIRQDVFAETLADVCASGDNFANCLKDYSDKSDYAFTKIIHHDGSIENDANDGSYRYAGSNFKFMPRYQKEYKNYASIIDYGILDNDQGCYYLDYHLDKDYNPTDEFVCFTTAGDAAKRAIEDGYIKENVKNYVCFGSDEVNCPNDNLYRIIGVFGDQIKLIKAEFATGESVGTTGEYLGIYSDLQPFAMFYFNKKAQNAVSSNWETSLLNTENFNTIYLNNFESKWIDMINDTAWNIGGHTTPSTPAKTFIGLEKAKQTTTKSKIGLMYVSDYGYAINKEYWSRNVYNYWGMGKYNWLYAGFREFTITPYVYNNRTDAVFYIRDEEGIDNSNGTAAVRPVFYLKNTITYQSGDGSQFNPYRIGNQ